MTNDQFTSNALLSHLSERIKSQSKRLVLGIGSGELVDKHLLPWLKGEIEYIGSIVTTNENIKKHQDFFDVNFVELNQAPKIDVFITQADQVNDYKEVIKASDSDFTSEKILSYYCDEFWVLTLPSGMNVNPLDQVLSVEVLPLARSAVSRAIVENVSFSPALRPDLTKPNGNYLIELHPNQAIINYQVEQYLKSLPGVVETSIFAMRPAARVFIVSSQNKVREI